MERSALGSNVHKRRVTLNGATVAEISVLYNSRKEQWYTRQDLSELSRYNKHTILAFRQARNMQVELDHEEYCIRGLEHQVSIRAQQQRISNVVSVVQSVLDEQRRQKESGTFDSYRISSASQRHSCLAKDIALERALEDTEEALGNGSPFRPFETDMFSTLSPTCAHELYLEECLAEALIVIDDRNRGVCDQQM